MHVETGIHSDSSFLGIWPDLSAGEASKGTVSLAPRKRDRRTAGMFSAPGFTAEHLCCRWTISTTPTFLSVSLSLLPTLLSPSVTVYRPSFLPMFIAHHLFFTLSHCYSLFSLFQVVSLNSNSNVPSYRIVMARGDIFMYLINCQKIFF